MALTILKTTPQKGLNTLGNSALPVNENLEARLNNPVLDDEKRTDIWAGAWLDSRTIQLYGGVNEDGRHRFKIDHEFDLSSIADKKLSDDGSVPITEEMYLDSQGTEFIIITRNELEGANLDYAIRADKYTGIREQLRLGKVSEAYLKDKGGFKLNEFLTPKEVYTNDGWLELAVGKNKATPDQYQLALTLLLKYILEGIDRDCFKKDVKGMEFLVETDVKTYKARSWFLYGSDGRSSADGKTSFYGSGNFLTESIPDTKPI